MDSDIIIDRQTRRVITHELCNKEWVVTYKYKPKLDFDSFISIALADIYTDYAVMVDGHGRSRFNIHTDIADMSFDDFCHREKVLNLKNHDMAIKGYSSSPIDFKYCKRKWSESVAIKQRGLDYFLKSCQERVDKKFQESIEKIIEKLAIDPFDIPADLQLKKFKRGDNLILLHFTFTQKHLFFIVDLCYLHTGYLPVIRVITPDRRKIYTEYLSSYAPGILEMGSH